MRLEAPGAWAPWSAWGGRGRGPGALRAGRDRGQEAARLLGKQQVTQASPRASAVPGEAAVTLGVRVQGRFRRRMASNQ